MKKMAIRFLVAAGVLAPCCATTQAALIARWTFDSGTSAGLTSDVGGFTLSETGNGGGQTTTYNSDGTVTIGGGRELYTAGLNSTAFPTLKSNATIYLRMRFDNTATGANAAIAGFMYGTSKPESSGGYNAHSTMGMVGGSTSTLSFYDLLSDSSAINPGSSLLCRLEFRLSIAQTFIILIRIRTMTRDYKINGRIKPFVSIESVMKNSIGVSSLPFPSSLNS